MALWQARLLGFCFLLATYGQAQTPLHLPDMPLHDPWILANTADHTYYLYTSNVPKLTGVNERGTMVYRSTDLKNWQQPVVVFRTSEMHWAHDGAWAPE